MICQQNPDGTWREAEPIGWQEEHGWLARLVFWLRGIEHCNDREGQRRVRRTPVRNWYRVNKMVAVHMRGVKGYSWGRAWWAAIRTPSNTFKETT